MRCFALRLVVALLTFVVGVTLAALWYTNRTEEIEVTVAPEAAPVVAGTQVARADPPSPPPGAAPADGRAGRNPERQGRQQADARLPADC